ncbi:SelB C-terminal domain-containing protein, partial [candidate division WOR-3 bacterium]|nr:SelB C-terminal domain-containing protein [candidate division WOR-3 bacterium]
QATIGGGVIIEPKATKAKGFDEKLIEHLQKIEAGDSALMIEENLDVNFELPRKVDEIAYDLNLPLAEVNEIINELLNNKKVLCIDEKRGLYYSQKNFEKLKNNIINILKEYHKNNPINTGIPQLELLKNISKGFDKSLLNYTLEKMSREKSVKLTDDNKMRLFDFKVVLDKNMDEIVKRLEEMFLDAEYKPPSYDAVLSQRLGDEKLVKKAYRYVLDTGILIFVGESIVMHKKMVEQAKEKLIQFLKSNEEIRISQFRDLLGASRKYVLPLLIYFDTHNVTIKRGEVRILGQKYR